MKKLSLVLIILVIFSMFTSSVFASEEIGLRDGLEDYSHVDFSSYVVFQKDLPNKLQSWGLGLSGSFKISPTFYLTLSNNFAELLTYSPITEITSSHKPAASYVDLIYLWGDKVTLDLELGLSGSFGSDNPPSFRYGLIASYIFLNKPSYKVGVTLSARNTSSYVSLLGLYSFSPELSLKPTIQATYAYSSENLTLYASLALAYKDDFLRVSLSYDYPDLLNKGSVSSFRDNLILSVKGEVPINNKFAFLYSASLGLVNLANPDHKAQLKFTLLPSLEYEVFDSFILSLGYSLRRLPSISSRSVGGVTTYTYSSKYFHQINLGIEYRF